MKSKQLFLFVIIVFANNVYAQIGINSDNSAPHPSAQLDVKSTNKGILLPRITNALPAAVPNPTAGLLIYDQPNARPAYYNGASWQALAGTTINTGLYGRFPNSKYFPSTIFYTGMPTLDYTWTVPAGVTQVWVEMWAAGNAGGYLPYELSPFGSYEFEGGASGDFASLLINVAGLPNLGISVGKGGYQNNIAGNTSVNASPNLFVVSKGYSGIILAGNIGALDGVIQFVSGTRGQKIIFDYTQISATNYMTLVRGGNGANAYPNQIGGEGVSGGYSTVTPFGLLIKSSLSGFNGATPGAGGGMGFGALYAGNGGPGLVVLHW